jgi:hypothetical protein
MDGVNVMVVLVLVKNVMDFRQKFEMDAYLDLIGFKVLIIQQ